MSAILPLPISSAPKDGTLIRLLIEFDPDRSWTPLQDENPCWTVGFNDVDNNEVDLWQFVGWHWTQDCFTHREAPEEGKVLGWLPLTAPTLSASGDQAEALAISMHKASISGRQTSRMVAWEASSDAHKADMLYYARLALAAISPQGLDVA